MTDDPAQFRFISDQEFADLPDADKVKYLRRASKELDGRHEALRRQALQLFKMRHEVRSA